MRTDSTNPARGMSRDSAPLSGTPSGTSREREPCSTFRAFQTAPLSRLASNGNEQAHVRTSAILGYN